MLFFLTKEHDEDWKDCGTFPTFKVGLCAVRGVQPQPPQAAHRSGASAQFPPLLAARLVMGLCARGWLQAKFNAIM